MYRAPAGGRHFSGYVMKEWTPGPYFSVIPVFQHPHSDENTGIDTRVYDITIYDETGSALCFMDKLELRNSGNTNTGWGGGESSSGGWGSGGCWGSSSKNDDVTDKTKPTTQKTVDTLQFRPHRIAPGVRRVLGGAHPKMLRIRLLLAVSDTGGGWGSSSKNADTADTNPPVQASSDNAWGSSSTTR